jgi:hypothetical protein
MELATSKSIGRPTTPSALARASRRGSTGPFSDDGDDGGGCDGGGDENDRPRRQRGRSSGSAGMDDTGATAVARR